MFSKEHVFVRITTFLYQHLTHTCSNYTNILFTLVVIIPIFDFPQFSLYQHLHYTGKTGCILLITTFPVLPENLLGETAGLFHWK